MELTNFIKSEFVPDFLEHTVCFDPKTKFRIISDLDFFKSFQDERYHKPSHVVLSNKYVMSEREMDDVKKNWYSLYYDGIIKSEMDAVDRGEKNPAYNEPCCLLLFPRVETAFKKINIPRGESVYWYFVSATYLGNNILQFNRGHVPSWMLQKLEQINEI